MSEPRIVTQQEAQQWLEEGSNLLVARLAHTVATEPDRIRAAVVKALRAASVEVDNNANEFYGPSAWRLVDDRADAIENGADF